MASKLLSEFATLIKRDGDRQQVPAPRLTERELEVLRLVALGYTNSEIAQKLYISVRTVETHRGHISQKLLLNSRAELVRYAAVTSAAARS